jgi:multimeric flavodoxin WrbA
VVLLKIIAISGSPRDENTDVLLKETLKGAKQAGADTELILLRNMSIACCDGCVQCEEGGKHPGECHIEDDMKVLYEKIEQADGIILGSPNYYSNMTGIMKDFFDRTLVFYGPRGQKLRGKRGGIVAVGGENGKPAIDAMKVFFGYGMRIVGTVDASASGAGDVTKDKTAMKAAYELGKAISSQM